MVDFGKLVRKTQSLDLRDPIKLFNSLDRQSSHTTLRPVQEQILSEIHKRRDERDLVLKMSTGAGKTAVGLIYLRSFMAETKRPGVYLCPTIQLVDQVLEEGSRLGIKASEYAGGEQYPGAGAMSGQVVIVCTYSKLFNAKTTFDRPDVLLKPVAIVLDDAHAGVEDVRDVYTLRIDGELHRLLLKVFNAGCKAYMPAKWANVIDETPEEFLEVPYWIWKPVLDEVISRLAPHMDEEPFCFVWPHLRDHLRWCRCIVSGTATEVVPEIMPVSMKRAFQQADHRLFMSGTLADDRVEIKEASKGTVLRGGSAGYSQAPKGLQAACAILTKDGHWVFEGRNRSHSVIWRELRQLMTESRLVPRWLDRFCRNSAYPTMKVNEERYLNEGLDMLIEARHQAVYNGFGMDDFSFDILINREPVDVNIAARASNYRTLAYGILNDVLKETTTLFKDIEQQCPHELERLLPQLCTIVYTPPFDLKRDFADTIRSEIDQVPGCNDWLAKVLATAMWR